MGERNGNHAGRPSKLNPQIRKKLTDAIAAGNYYMPACQYAGISYQTFLNWMERGRNSKSGQYFEFFEAVLEAEAEAEVRTVANWQQQIPENWAAARDFLARRHPERWGPKETTRHIGKDEDTPIQITIADLAKTDNDDTRNGDAK